MFAVGSPKKGLLPATCGLQEAKEAGMWESVRAPCLTRQRSGCGDVMVSGSALVLDYICFGIGDRIVLYVIVLVYRFLKN